MYIYFFLNYTEERTLIPHFTFSLCFHFRSANFSHAFIFANVNVLKMSVGLTRGRCRPLVIGYLI